MRLLFSIVVYLAVAACAAEPAPYRTTETPAVSGLSGTLDPLTCIPAAGAQWSSSGGQLMLIGYCDMPLDLQVGAQVPILTATVRDNGPSCSGCFDQNAVLMQLVSFSGSTGTVLGQVFSNESGQTQTISISVSHMVTGTELIRLRFASWMELGQTPTRMSAIGVIRPIVGIALPVPGSDFVADAVTPATRVGPVWTFAAASTQRLVSGLHLAPGSVINDIQWSFIRQAGTMRFEVTRRSLGDGGAGSATLSTQDIDTTSGWRTALASSGGPFPITILPGYIYQLAVVATSSGQFDGAMLLE